MRIIVICPPLIHFSKLEQYYIIREVIAEISGSRRDFFTHNFENIRNLFKLKVVKVSLNNGLEVVKEYDKLIIKFSEEPKPVPEPIVVEEDRSRVVWGDYRFSFKLLKKLPNRFSNDPLTVCLDADKVKNPFVIRVVNLAAMLEWKFPKMKVSTARVARVKLLTRPKAVAKARTKARPPYVFTDSAQRGINSLTEMVL